MSKLEQPAGLELRVRHDRDVDGSPFSLRTECRRGSRSCAAQL